MKKTLFKKVFLVIFALTFKCVSYCQDIKREKLVVKYFQSSSQTKSDLKTYKLTIELASPVGSDSSKIISNRIASAVALPVLKQVRVNADLEVYVRLEGYDVNNGKIQIVDRTEFYKLKPRGTMDITVYRGRCEIKYPLFMTIRNVKKNETIYEGYIEDSNEWQSVFSPEQHDYDAAETLLRKLVDKIKPKLFDKHIEALGNIISAKLLNDPSIYSWSLNYVESSEKDNYDNIMAAKDSTLEAVRLYSRTSISPGVEQKLSRTIDLWQNIITQSAENAEMKLNKKVVSGIQENIANCYFLLHNFSAAQSIVNQSKAFREQEWQEALSQKIVEAKKLFEASGIQWK
jgi:hypothetical protein